MKKSYAIKGATYRRQKGKREWDWNSTKAFASRDLNEPKRNRCSTQQLYDNEVGDFTRKLGAFVQSNYATSTHNHGIKYENNTNQVRCDAPL